MCVMSSQFNIKYDFVVKSSGELLIKLIYNKILDKLSKIRSRLILRTGAYLYRQLINQVSVIQIKSGCAKKNQKNANL